MTAPAEQKVYALPTPKELREMRLARRMRELGIGTREAALAAREAAMESAAHWHRKCMTARYLTERLLALLAEANRQRDHSEALLADAQAELARIRGERCDMNNERKEKA